MDHAITIRDLCWAGGAAIVLLSVSAAVVWFFIAISTTDI